MEANPNPSEIGKGGGCDNPHTSALTVLNSIGKKKEIKKEKKENNFIYFAVLEMSRP